MILGQNPHYVGNVSTEAEKQALIEKYGNQALRPAVKMSKSLGNVVNPDDVVKAYGADTMRLYIMFVGDFEQAARLRDTVFALKEMTKAHFVRKTPEMREADAWRGCEELAAAMAVGAVAPLLLQRNGSLLV